ncbi:MAG: hypothetical protein R3E86_12685 [Pseudomonadales bacterium]
MNLLKTTTLLLGLTLASSVAMAAPAAKGPENGKGMPMEKAQKTVREEAETREREAKNAPADGEMTRTEAEERAREMREGAGSEQSQQMQERKEERKEIQEQYREQQKSGEGEPAKKKPWWKFWQREGTGS